MLKTLIDLGPMLKQLGASLKNGATWIDRLDVLRSSMPATLPGQPRQFDVNHAKELLLVAAFVKGGARPRHAAGYAAQMMIDVKRGAKLPQWMVVAAGDFKTARPAEDRDIPRMPKAFGTVPITLIPIRAISDMVDKFYEAQNAALSR